MALMAAVSSVASLVRDWRVRSPAQPACSIDGRVNLYIVVCGSPEWLKPPQSHQLPGARRLVEGLRYIACECATSAGAWTSQDAGHLVASLPRAAELTAVNRAITRTSTGGSFTQEHSRGEPHGAPWRSPLGRAARSQSDEGDETKKYAVERRSTLSSVRNILPS